MTTAQLELVRIGRVLTEALAMARAQRAATFITFAVVTGMSLAVLLTIGRTAAAEQQILDRIDEVGSRAITIRAEPGAEVRFDVAQRLGALQGVEWVGVFGPASDVTNAVTGGNIPVSLRTLVTADRTPLNLPNPVLVDSGYGSPQSLDLLGLPDSAGFVETADGVGHAIAGRYDPPSFLEPFDPLVIVPAISLPDAGQPVALVVVVADSPHRVAALATTTATMLGATDPSKITVETSREIAQLRALVQGDLGGYGRSLTLMLMALLAVLVAALMTGLVLLRRKDFGRRRALGAKRSLIITLIAANTLIIATAAAAVGTGIAVLTLVVTQEPLPDCQFIVAVAILTVSSAGLGAVPAGLVASRRDPLTELRVP